MVFEMGRVECAKSTVGVLTDKGLTHRVSDETKTKQKFIVLSQGVELRSATLHETGVEASVAHSVQVQHPSKESLEAQPIPAYRCVLAADEVEEMNRV